MLFLLIFSFLAGFLTLLSPCILPILPAVLSGGIAQGKRSPLGVILGLMSSFTFFTLFLTFIVQKTPLSPHAFRSTAICGIALFGLVLFFPSLSLWFTRLTSPIANWGQKLIPSRSGFGSAFLFGVALGLVWTPCAGPILAAITTLAATQAMTLSTFLITCAYSLGAGIPLFLIAYGGRRLIESSRVLSSHSETIRRFFGALMLFTALALALHWDVKIQQKLSPLFPSFLIEDNPLVTKELDKLRSPSSSQKTTPLQIGEEAPELIGITNWINSPPLSLKRLKGKVVLLDFWNYSCINCLKALPHVEKWYHSYKEEGFVVIGIHTPEFAFEKSAKNVSSAVHRLGLSYPIAEDNLYETWQAYHNRYWPTLYLLDQKGVLFSVHIGEGNYLEIENEIRRLLGLPPLDLMTESSTPREVSSECYLGAIRGRSYTSEISLHADRSFFYSYKSPLLKDQVGLKGKWTVFNERITAESDESFLNCNFLGKQAYLVLSGSSDTPIQVYLDGEQFSSFLVDGDRKYDIQAPQYGRFLLSLKIPEGISAYTLSFGDDPL